MQLNPSPSVNGAWHVQVKFPLSNPSLSQTAFASQGMDKQGSGTDNIAYIIILPVSS